MRMQVKLEIGHKAACRQEPTDEGFTHDWTVFVRGLDGKDISYFVEKVIFHLHESFPRPKRAIKEPPFKLDEHGYGSFELQIDVCFKTKDEPRRVTFSYDLFLPIVGCPPVTNVRTEALTFTYPSEDFMKKLLKGGGVPMPPDSTNGLSGNGISNGHAKEDITQRSFNVPESDRVKKKLLKPSSKPGPVVGMKRSPSSHDDPSMGVTVKKKKRLSESGGSVSKSKLPGSTDEGKPISQSLTTEVKDLKIKFKPIPPRESEKHKEHTDSTHKEKSRSHSSKGKELKNLSEHVPENDSKGKHVSGEHKSKLRKNSEKLDKKHMEKKEKREKEKKERKVKDELDKEKRSKEKEKKTREREEKENEKKVKERDDKEKKAKEKEEKDKEEKAKEREGKEIEKKVKERDDKENEKKVKEREEKEKEKKVKEKEEKEKEKKTTEQDEKENEKKVKERDEKEDEKKVKEREEKENEKKVKEREEKEKEKKVKDKEDKEKKVKEPSEKDKKAKDEKKDKKTVEKVTIRRSSGDSWASSGSSCGLMANVVSKNKALGKLLSELSEDEDDERDLLTPFKREPSPVPSKTSIKEKDGEVFNFNNSQHKAKEQRTRSNSSNVENSVWVNHVQNASKDITSGSENDSVDTVEYKTSSPSHSEKNGVNKLPKKELYDLFEHISNCQNSTSLQKVVDVIETTGLFTVSEKTLEFDLCCLEKATLRKIQKCLGLR